MQYIKVIENENPRQTKYLRGINFSLELNFTDFASFG